MQIVSMRRLLTVGVFSLLAVSFSRGQTRFSLNVTIPFEFSIGKKVLPAGTYQFVSSPEKSWLVVKGAKGGDMNLSILTRLSADTSFRDASLVFDRSEDQHILSEVWMPGQDGLLVHSTPKGHSHEIVVASDQAATLSGKEVFDSTCKRCHGPGGAGNQAADKFFQVTIPRLNSAYVQSKSDEELKEIITHGKRNMEPVRMGMPTVQHRLSLQSVDAVIGYVRTLKQK